MPAIVGTDVLGPSHQTSYEGVYNALGILESFLEAHGPSSADVEIVLGVAFEMLHLWLTLQRASDTHLTV